jgi:hypothetical protein
LQYEAVPQHSIGSEDFDAQFKDQIFKARKFIISIFKALNFKASTKNYNLNQSLVWNILKTGADKGNVAFIYVKVYLCEYNLNLCWT